MARRASLCRSESLIDSSRGIQQCDDLFYLALHGRLLKAFLYNKESTHFQLPEFGQEISSFRLLFESAQGHSRGVAAKRVEDLLWKGFKIGGFAALADPETAFDVDAPWKDLAEGPAERREVVVGGPSIETQVLLMKEGLPVQDPDDLRVCPADPSSAGCRQWCP